MTATADRERRTLPFWPGLVDVPAPAGNLDERLERLATALDRHADALDRHAARLAAVSANLDQLDLETGRLAAGVAAVVDRVRVLIRRQGRS